MDKESLLKELFDYYQYKYQLSKDGTVKVYKATESITDSIKINTVINSSYKPLDEKDLVNPANENVNCNKDASVTIYRDEDYVYYYKIKKSDFRCLLDETDDITNLPDNITNLPDGSGC